MSDTRQPDLRYQGADAINLSQLTPLTQSALAFFVEERLGWSGWGAWVEPERLAWLTFILAETPDDPNLFVHGKWATIQFLQGLLKEQAAKEVTAPSPVSQQEERR